LRLEGTSVLPPAARLYAKGGWVADDMGQDRKDADDLAKPFLLVDWLEQSESQLADAFEQTLEDDATLDFLSQACRAAFAGFRPPPPPCSPAVSVACVAKARASPCRTTSGPLGG